MKQRQRGSHAASIGQREPRENAKPSAAHRHENPAFRRGLALETGAWVSGSADPACSDPACSDPAVAAGRVAALARIALPALLIGARIALLLLARVVRVVLVLVGIRHCGFTPWVRRPMDQRTSARNVPNAAGSIGTERNRTELRFGALRMAPSGSEEQWEFVMGRYALLLAARCADSDPAADLSVRRPELGHDPKSDSDFSDKIMPTNGAIHA